MADMKKPDAVLDSVADQCPPTSTPSGFPINLPDPSIRGDAFDQQLKNRGIRFIHKRATPCPNLRNLEDNTHSPNCPICDGSGILRYKQREIVGVFQGNSLQRLFEQQGIWEVGTATITMPTQYEDGTQADFNTFDHLIIPDFEIRTWELKEYEPRADNRQRVRYPITGIDHMSSVENGELRVYEEGVDYNLVDGEIEWISGKEPAYDNINERGTVLTISYFCNPVYSVLQSMRELRVTQELIDGQKTARRLPQEILVKRDFLVSPPEKLAGVE